MARVFQLPENDYQVVNKDGETILSAPLLDLYYLIANSSEEPQVSDLPNDQKFTYVAEVVNRTYNSQLTGGQILSIFIDLTESVEESKKNTIS
jgi:hypothetical protein